MKSNLEKAGFKGELQFLLDEEGSGAEIYNCSVYFPDSRRNPKTRSGVTIDPGLDLGNASKTLCKKVIAYYEKEGLLTKSRTQLLELAFGRKRLDAVIWMQNYEKHFKNQFLVNDKHAAYVMANFTALDYWNPLKNAMPGLNSIRPTELCSAIHSALLSQAYNRGWTRVIRLAKDFIEKGDYEGLAVAISKIRHSTKALTERRKREAKLISDNLDAEIELPTPEPRPHDYIPGRDLEESIEDIKGRDLNE